MIIEKIRTVTATAHEDLERSMVPRIKEITTPDQYADLLAVFYGYYHPIEMAIEKVLNEEALPDYTERRKTSWILSDLSSIGKAGISLPLNEEGPAINDMADALGALYVMEGSTLGGKIISKMIGENLDYTDKSSLSFFYGYGPDAAPKWKEFIARLESYATEENSEQIVAKANEVFLGFKQWTSR